MTDLETAKRLCDHLGIGDADPQVIARALRHPSYVQEMGRPPTESNQPLEFLGDAVLDLLLADHLLRHGEGRGEGDLTKLKSLLAREATLARVGRRVGLGEFLLLGRGEEDSGGREKDSLIADAIEALIAAIYLSAGLESAREFVVSHFAEELEAASHRGPSDDPKTRLQELLQERTKQLPDYHTVPAGGPAHEPSFSSECRFRGQRLGRGSGRSKRGAEKAAAADALSDLDALWETVARIEAERSDAASA